MAATTNGAAAKATTTGPNDAMLDLELILASLPLIDVEFVGTAVVVAPKPHCSEMSSMPAWTCASPWEATA